MPDPIPVRTWTTFYVVRSAAGVVLVQKSNDGCTRSVRKTARPSASNPRPPLAPS